MKTNQITTHCIGALLMFSVAHADFATDLRPDWNIPPQYSYQLVNKVAFTKEMYGLNYAYAILSVTGYESYSVNIANGDYHLIVNDIEVDVSRLVIEDFITKALGFPVVGKLALVAYEMSINATSRFFRIVCQP